MPFTLIRLLTYVCFANVLLYSSAEQTTVESFWKCGGNANWIRSVGSGDPSGDRFVQLDKASCVYSLEEKSPVCVATGTDGGVWEYSQGIWLKALRPKIPLDSRFSCINSSSTRITCFTRGFDGAIWKTERILRSYWTDFVSLGGLTADTPSCVTIDTGEGVCYFRGLDGIARFARIDTDAKIEWTEVDETEIASAIRCFKDVSNTATCVALNGSSAVLWLTWTWSSHTKWQPMNAEGKLFDSPGCIRQQLADRMDCFGRRLDNRLVLSQRGGSGWTDWMEVGSEIVLSNVQCVNIAAGTSACYYVADGMKLKSQFSTDDEWRRRRNYSLFYLEEPECIAVPDAAVFCLGRAVPDVSRQICESVRTALKTW